MDPISEQRLSEVHPKLAAQVRELAEELAEENISIRIVQGLRSWAEQQAIWQEGRDGSGNIIDAAKVVTHAKPGYSWHNYGLAVDVAPFDAGIPDWNRSHPAWARIVSVGESLGMVSGSTFKDCPDWPHFQMTGQLPESPDDAVRIAYQQGGMQAVWNDTLL